MYYVSTQGIDERTINVHYYYYYYKVGKMLAKLAVYIVACYHPRAATTTNPELVMLELEIASLGIKKDRLNEVSAACAVREQGVGRVWGGGERGGAGGGGYWVGGRGDVMERLWNRLNGGWGCGQRGGRGGGGYWVGGGDGETSE